MSSSVRIPPFTSLALLAALGALVTGCANLGEPATAARYSQLNGSYSPIDEGEDPFQCPIEANVLPARDTELDGTGRYSACYARTSLYDIRLDPVRESGQPERLCVFPVQYVDPTTSYLKPDLITGRPLSECRAMENAAFYFKFELVRYNAVITVPESSREAMTSCLESGQGWACPDYSYGRFRQ